MYQYAKLNEYIDRDLTEGLVYEWTNSTEQIHDRYSDEEIKTLWSKLYEINNVDIILIMIYTGLRPNELLEIQTENIHLDEKSMACGMKTEAGKDRIIPLNDKIIPLVKNRYDPNKKYLINNKFGNHYTYGTYMNGNFNTCMGKLKGIMETIYANISDAAKRYNATVGGQTDYVAGANIAGFEKVVDAMLAQGVC